VLAVAAAPAASTSRRVYIFFMLSPWFLLVRP
jgi:hypothetical protein